jgi:septal ring factor EnvC (AmiA/AmiB activator)
MSGDSSRSQKQVAELQEMHKRRKTNETTIKQLRTELETVDAQIAPLQSRRNALQNELLSRVEEASVLTEAEAGILMD